MRWPEGVTGRRKVLVNALTWCLERSKVCEVVDAGVVRSVLESAAGEIWREGEFRLEYVWKILCQQPGLSAREVAPPLLAFKGFEELLPGVEVRLPAAVTALPKAEQTRLRDELTLARDELAAKLEGWAEEASAEEDKEKAAAEARRATAPARPSGQRPVAAPARPSGQRAVVAAPPSQARRKRLAIGLSLVAVLGLGAVAASILFDQPDPFAIEEVGGPLSLRDGKREGAVVVATISDPRWNQMPEDEQRKHVERVLQALVAKKVESLTLVDTTGRTRALGAVLGGQPTVTILPAGLPPQPNQR